MKSARFRFDPTLDTYGGLLGRWSVDIVEGDKVVEGCHAGYAQCVEFAREHGVPRRLWDFDEAARKAAWAAFRRRYSR